MHLIVGLGNPGAEYQQTRHNIGFMAVDALAQQMGQSFHLEKSHKAELTKGNLAGYPLLLAKPQTYMNLSGEAVGSIARYYKIEPEQVLVIFDDVTLPLGRLRLRPGGSDGGQNGMKSLIQHLGTQKIPRLRLGIGPQPERIPLKNYVLQAFPSEQQGILTDVLEKGVETVTYWLAHGTEATRNQYNGWLHPSLISTVEKGETPIS